MERKVSLSQTMTSESLAAAPCRAPATAGNPPVEGGASMIGWSAQTRPPPPNVPGCWRVPCVEEADGATHCACPGSRRSQRRPGPGGTALLLPRRLPAAASSHRATSLPRAAMPCRIMERGPALFVHCGTIRRDSDGVLHDLRMTPSSRNLQRSVLAIGLRVDSAVRGLRPPAPPPRPL
jgi:hypothetical protein